MRTAFKSFLIIIGLIFVISVPLFAEDQGVSDTVIGNGIGMGSALAIAICWSRTHSVLTSMLAGVFGWFYVIYFVIIRESETKD